MVKALRELAQNYIKFRQETKRISTEIDSLGIEKYIEKHYGTAKRSSPSLRQKHA